MGEAAVATERWGETRHLTCPVVQEPVVAQVDFFGIRGTGHMAPTHVSVVARPVACSGSDRCGATRPGLVDPLDGAALSKMGCPLRTLVSDGQPRDDT